MKVTVDSQISAPRHVVFEHVMDVTNWPKIISAIEKVEILTPGPIGVGTKLRETRNMFGHQASEDMTIREIIPDEKIVLTAQNHGADYCSQHLFEDDGSGTRMTVTFDAQPVSLVAHLMTPVSWIMANSMRKVLATDLADLKSAIETSTSPSTP